MVNSFFFLILCRTVVENSKSVRRNIRRSTFFQREFKVLTFLHSADKIFRNDAIDLRYFIKSRTLI